MRRLLIVLCLVLTIGGAMTAPVLAQARDPFAPVVTENEPGVPGDEPGNADPIDVTPFDPTNGGSEGLPNTGGDPSSWWVLAYGLLATGSVALVVAWSRRPISLR
jgi:LPXTG-motif cell wall-anchored protein